ncbi:MAG: hypothetical protein KC731_39165, partial [Myxococcales bacterium]|nr:hypothetical protein [Myxococcales bacterium]
MRLRLLPWLAALVVGLVAAPSAAQAPDPPASDPSGAPAPSASPSSSAPPAGSAESVKASCVEYVPQGAQRPHLESKLPSRGRSGYAVELLVTVTHGPGETVMPDGFQLRRGSDAMLALEEGNWVVPDPGGGVAPLVDRPEPAPDATSATTNVMIPFVPLPEEPGRHLMTLPPVPITVARAGGQVMTLCTPPMRITVEDPIANEVNPAVRPNPPPRPQREEWVAARQATYAFLAALALSVVLAWLWIRYRNRPKPVVEKPREHPWVVAMRELDALRTSPLLAEGKLDEFFDAVDNVTRRYLGERYGFDGLESTSEEIRADLARVYPPLKNLPQIDRFLSDSDFVKYAEVSPSQEDCDEAMTRAREIVTTTVPPTHGASTGPKPRVKRR